MSRALNTRAAERKDVLGYFARRQDALRTFKDKNPERTANRAAQLRQLERIHADLKSGIHESEED